MQQDQRPGEPLPAPRARCAGSSRAIKTLGPQRPARAGSRRHSAAPRRRAGSRTASRGRSAPAAASAPSGGRRTSSCRGSRPCRRTAGRAGRRATPSRWLSSMKATPSPWAAASRISWPESKWSIAAGCEIGQADRLAPIVEGLGQVAVEEDGRSGELRRVGQRVGPSAARARRSRSTRLLSSRRE